jgi:hypothetical protein
LIPGHKDVNVVRYSIGQDLIVVRISAYFGNINGGLPVEKEPCDEFIDPTDDC